MLDCTIVGITQSMDFEQNVTLTYLNVRLPGGEQLQAAIDEETAAKVVGLMVKTKGMPRAAMQVPAPLPAAPAHVAEAAPVPGEVDPSPYGAHEGESVAIFGGQDTTPSPAAEAVAAEEARIQAEGSPTVVEGPILEPAPVQQPRRGRLQRGSSGKLIAPARTVPKDDAGYPIVSSEGVDPATLTGTRNTDEDGVGSI